MTTLTKSTGTVALSGAAEKVTLPASYGWVWVKNMSEGDIFAGLSADISEGADGVLTIPAGECGRVQTDGFSSIYLLGTGNALVVAQNYADCPFKVVKKGGEIPDLSAYAKKADVPKIKVNEAVNADTVGGKSADDFIRRYGAELLSEEYVSVAAMDTDYKGVVNSDVANNIGLDGSNACWWHIIGLKNFNDDGYGTQIAIPLFPNSSAQNPKYRTSVGTVFQSWKEISTTPIKSTTFSATADGTGNFNLWTPSENKIPIAIQLDNKPFSVVLFLHNNQMWLGSTINEVTRQPVTDTAVSGTVYYIEV